MTRQFFTVSDTDPSNDEALTFQCFNAEDAALSYVRAIEDPTYPYRLEVRGEAGTRWLVDVRQTTTATLVTR